MKNKGLYIVIGFVSCIISGIMGEYTGEKRMYNLMYKRVYKTVLDTPVSIKHKLDTMNPKRIKKIHYTMTNVILKR